LWCPVWCCLLGTGPIDLFLCSEVDKAHLRLAAAKGILRLARRWDTQIPVDIFQMVLLVLQVCLSENLFAASVVFQTALACCKSNFLQT
jgi:hypothetical protein